MLVSETTVVLFGLVAVQVVGLAAAVLARLSVGSRHQGKCQWLFIACLALVGLATIVALGVRPGFWLATGTSFCLMVLTATCDLSRTREVQAW